MKLPKIWRKKRKDGKEYGNCYATVAGDDVNLGSSDYDKAGETLQSILMQKAAEASGIEDGAADQTGGTAESQGTIPTPAVAPSPAPIVPDKVIPPSSEADARAEAEATNAAAAETGGPAAASSPADAAAALGLTPQMLDGLLEQGAQAIVLLQLELQGWIVKKRTGKIPPQLNLESGPAKVLVDAAAKGWIAQLKIWFPDIELCPPWLIAVGAPLLFLPVQIAGAKEDPAAAKTSGNVASEPVQAAA